MVGAAAPSALAGAAGGRTSAIPNTAASTTAAASRDGVVFVPPVFPANRPGPAAGADAGAAAGAAGSVPAAASTGSGAPSAPDFFLNAGFFIAGQLPDPCWCGYRRVPSGSFGS